MCPRLRMCRSSSRKDACLSPELRPIWDELDMGRPNRVRDFRFVRGAPTVLPMHGKLDGLWPGAGGVRLCASSGRDSVHLEPNSATYGWIQVEGVGCPGFSSVGRAHGFCLRLEVGRPVRQPIGCWPLSTLSEGGGDKSVRKGMCRCSCELDDTSKAL